MVAAVQSAPARTGRITWSGWRNWQTRQLEVLVLSDGDGGSSPPSDTLCLRASSADRPGREVFPSYCRDMPGVLAVNAVDVTKRYGSLVAVDAITVRVAQGDVY